MVASDVGGSHVTFLMVVIHFMGGAADLRGRQGSCWSPYKPLLTIVA
jgi:hypothetical protein